MFSLLSVCVLPGCVQQSIECSRVFQAMYDNLLSVCVLPGYVRQSIECLRVFQAMYDKAMAEKQMLLDDAENCRRKMTNATALIDGLSGERVRWTEASKTFQSQVSHSHSKPI